MKKNRVAFLLLASTLTAGCGGENTMSLPESEKAKIKTETTPEKSTAGKKATAPKAGVD